MEEDQHLGEAGSPVASSDDRSYGRRVRHVSNSERGVRSGTVIVLIGVLFFLSTIFAIASPGFACTGVEDPTAGCNQIAARAADAAAAAKYNEVYTQCLQTAPGEYLFCDGVAQTAADAEYARVFAEEFVKCIEGQGSPAATSGEIFPSDSLREDTSLTHTPVTLAVDEAFGEVIEFLVEALSFSRA